MAKDIPEYEQSEVVQPGTAPSGFTEAFSQVGKAYEPIAQFGLQLAQNASNQRAQQQAIEDAQTPGRKIWPGLLPIDAEYNRIYKQEEANVIQHQGNQFLRKAYEDLAKNPNPTPQTLLEFEQGTKSGLNDLVLQADKSSQPAIKRNFQSAYEGYFYDLGHKVETSNKKFEKEQYESQSELRNEKIADAARQGRVEALEQLQKESIQALEINAKKENWSSEKLELSKQASEEYFSTKLAEGAYVNLDDKEKDEFISELRKDPSKSPILKDLGAAQQDRVIQSLQQFANKYQSAFEGQRYIDYTNAQTELAKGTLTPARLADVEEQIGPHYSAQLRKQIAAAGSKAAETASSIADIDRNKDNATALATKSKEQLDSWFSDKAKIFQDSQGREPTLKEQVSNIATAIRVPIPSLNKKFSNSMLYGDKDSSSKAMQAYAMATPREKEALSLVDKDAASMATDYMTRLNAGNNPDDAWAKTKEIYGTLSPQQIEAIDDNFKDLTKSGGKQDLSNSKVLESKAAKALDFPKAKMPVELPMLWKQAMSSNFRTARGNWDVAEKITNDEIKRAWGVSTIDGDEKVMFLPPEKYVKDFEHGADFIRNQMLDGFKDIAAKYKKLYDSEPSQDFYYELDVKEIETKNKLEPKYKGGTFGITAGGEIRVKKVFRNGDVQKGKIGLEADQRTLLPATGDVPNYYIGINVNGVSLPLRDPKNQYEPLRYQPDFSQELYDQYIKQQEKAAKTVKKHEQSYRKRQADYELKNEQDIALESIEEDISGY